jgi:Ca-activated chloride channel family protein
MRHRVITALAAGLLTVAFAGCGGDGASSSRRPEIDARRYYDDYVEGETDMAAGGAMPTTMAPMPSATSATTASEAPPYWPDPDEDNTFVDSGDSTFVATADDAESTFALDVDTGSYRTARAQLATATALDPASIRVEEWVNAFDYDDPTPTDGPVGVSVETATAPHTDDGTALVRIAVDTATVDDTDRPAANITFVIDTSGSMDIRDRLGLVQSSLALLVQHLRDDDTISIVTYGDEATPVLAPTKVADAERILAAIDELGPGGSTNMEAGLALGYQQARTAFDPDALNVVLLASDGVANVGTTDADELTTQITKAGEEGIHLVTVGYGMGNYNDHLMEQLADQGDGFYSYVDTFEEAERLFVDDLTPTLTVVAKDAKAQVRFDPATVESYRLIGYENRGLDDEQFHDDTVDAGELGAGHAVTALYEVRPIGAPAALQGTTAGFGTVTVRWTDPHTGVATERAAAIPTAQPEASPSLRLAATVAELAEALRGNAVVVHRGVTVDMAAADADALVTAGVPGADELAELAHLAARGG